MLAKKDCTALELKNAMEALRATVEVARFSRGLEESTSVGSAVDFIALYKGA